MNFRFLNLVSIVLISFFSGKFAFCGLDPVSVEKVFEVLASTFQDSGNPIKDRLPALKSQFLTTVSQHNGSYSVSDSASISLHLLRTLGQSNGTSISGSELRTLVGGFKKAGLFTLSTQVEGLVFRTIESIKSIQSETGLNGKITWVFASTSGQDIVLNGADFPSDSNSSTRLGELRVKHGTKLNLRLLNFSNAKPEIYNFLFGNPDRAGTVSGKINPGYSRSIEGYLRDTYRDENALKPLIASLVGIEVRVDKGGRTGFIKGYPRDFLSLPGIVNLPSLVLGIQGSVIGIPGWVPFTLDQVGAENQ